MRPTAKLENSMETQPGCGQRLRHRIGLWLRPIDTKKDVARLYHELLYAVESKHYGESRHETALRYIRSAEHSQTKVGVARSST